MHFSKRIELDSKGTTGYFSIIFPKIAKGEYFCKFLFCILFTDYNKIINKIITYILNAIMLIMEKLFVRKLPKIRVG